jgi:hypothetical protein
MAMRGRPAASRATAVYMLLVVLAGAFLIRASEGLIFQNDGDFLRTSGFMLQRATRALEVTGDFRSGPFGTIEEFSPAAYVFLAFGWIQRLFSSQYHLAVASIAGKVVVLAGIAVLAAAAAGPQRPWARAVLFAGLAASAFAAHNAGLLKSFYLDYTVFLALPFLMAAFFAQPGAWRSTGLVVGSLVVGLSKVQFFYVPLLVLASLALVRRRSDPRIPAVVVAGLLIAQVLCALPAQANPHRHLNYYHSTFFGSYLVMTPQQLQSLHLSPKEMGCIGVDAWGNFGAGPGALDVHPGKPTCVADRPPDISRVLQPYLSDPLTLARLFEFAFPGHFTVAYFHVYPDFRMLQVLEGSAPAGQGLLLKLTDWRERYLTPVVAWLIAVALAVCLVGVRGGDRRYAPLLFFIVAFVGSQLVICLVGEGVRDLSRHLWAAQLSIDLLLPLLAWRLFELASQRVAGGQMQVRSLAAATMASQQLPFEEQTTA